MDQKQLLETAKQIEAVSEKSAVEYEQKKELMAEKINNIFLGRADLEELIGKDNTNMMKDNHANHVRFIASVLHNYNPGVLLDTVLWVFRAYRSHGFTTNYWVVLLNAWVTVMKEYLSKKSYTEIYPFYEWMLISIPSFVVLSDMQIENSNSLP